MTMIRWNPLAELEELRRKMDRLIEESSQRVRQPELPERNWQPVVEIHETPTELVVELDLPGVPQEDIQVHIEEHTLLVSGERKPADAAALASHHSERSYGPFHRAFALPGNFDESRTSASCEHGVLRIRLWKKAPEQSQRIDVAVK